MTFDQFCSMAREGVAVQCRTAKERKEVLELFDECGFRIGSATMSYMRPDGERNITYMHPVYQPKEDIVCCYKHFEIARCNVSHGIRYEDVRNLIENPPKIDERSDAEFANDFVSLMC